MTTLYDTKLRNAIIYSQQAQHTCKNGHLWCARKQGGACAIAQLQKAKDDVVKYHGQRHYDTVIHHAAEHAILRQQPKRTRSKTATQAIDANK